MQKLQAVAAIVAMAAVASTITPTKARATIVDGTFSGVVYQFDGGPVSEPITGAFSYDTALLTRPFLNLPTADVYGQAVPNVISISETVNGTTRLFIGDASSLFLSPWEFSLRAEELYGDQSTVTVYFQDPIITPTNPVVNFSMSLPPYQGSSNAYYGGGHAYQFYVAEVETHAAVDVPEPSGFGVLGSALFGALLMCWSSSRRSAAWPIQPLPASLRKFGPMAPAPPPPARPPTPEERDPRRSPRSPSRRRR